jgi:acyl-CoA thioesterase I
MLRLGLAIAGLLAVCATAVGAPAAPIIIVAVGASNTSGWGVPDGSAYPEQLQVMLRAKGIDARVINAGRPFDTTGGMLIRIDQSVPDGTRIAILQPGGNDLRFLGTREQRSANIAAMASRLRARNILVIVFDPEIPPQYYAWDHIHLTTAGHTWIAVSLLPQVMATLRQAGKPPTIPLGRAAPQ